MNASIPVAWLADGRLVSPMPHGLILDPDPDAPAVEIPWQIREDALSLAGTNDFLCVAVHASRRTNVARVNGATGEVLWSLPDDAAPATKREKR